MISARITTATTLLVSHPDATWIHGRMIATAVIALETHAGIEHKRTLVSRRELFSRSEWSDSPNFQAEHLGTELTIDTEIPDVAIGAELLLVGYGYPEVSR